MNVQAQPDNLAAKRRLPFEVVALVLQGGGALGAYQAGVYQALSEAGIHPNWISGVSIGAINAAIIAGNPPDTRIDRLRDFWTQVTADGPWPGAGDACFSFAKGDTMRQLINQMSANFERWAAQEDFSARDRYLLGFSHRARSRQQAFTTRTI
jgi:NTE family protein